jgi:hypothetical protein
MVLVDEIKIKKTRVLRELKNLKWKMVQSNEKGIDFIQNISKKKYLVFKKILIKK